MPAGRVFLILTAAGSSSRFGGEKKELLKLNGASVLQTCLSAFEALPDISRVVITYPEGQKADIIAALDPLFVRTFESHLTGKIMFAQGGSTRQKSVACGLEALAAANVGEVATGDACGDIVLIHDAARPWVQADLVKRVLDGAMLKGACIPVVDFADTPKEISADGIIVTHPARANLKAAQTPQGFIFEKLLEAHRRAELEHWTCTDDSSIWHRYVGPVFTVQGERSNMKITYREDMPTTSPPIASRAVSAGEGWDIHPLVSGRNLMLGGVRIPFDKGESGHSDGDVLWHAIIDSLLGAAGLGDIGTHFPPSEARWKDADSSELARAMAKLVTGAGFEILSLDSTVLIERPRIGPHRDAIRQKIAETLGIDIARVSVKAKTYEGFGPVGQGEAVEARALALLSKS